MGKREEQDYYIGLDCGTNSVGWAVTDENYNLVEANGKIKQNHQTKTKKKALWGTRLFDETETAAERRVYRSTRRRIRRAENRLKLLRLLFRDEILKVDPDFYQRLKQSFYLEEDKTGLQHKSKNALFNDDDFTDKDYFEKYHTIWHLRQAIVKAGKDEHFDIRLYFLAIQHILKHRGHFLIEGEMKNGGEDFGALYDEFCTEAEKLGYAMNFGVESEAEKIIKSKTTKTNKKKALAELMFIEGDELDEDQPKGQKELAGLLVGSKVSLNHLFNLEHDEDYKLSFSEGVLEDKMPDIESHVGTDNLDLVLLAKRIYDYGILSHLLGDHTQISDAMVANYELHQEDLKQLKAIFKPHKEIYDKLFRAEIYDEKFPSYNAYIGKARTDKHKPVQLSQEDFNKHLRKLFAEIDYTGELLERTETGEKATKPLLLPKQRGQAKGTIPEQLHHNELEMILTKLAQDYPSFAEVDESENEKYNTKCKKIAQIHSFRIPYYCGPLVNRNKSQFSWADEEISELVRPWNFDRLINKEQRAENFIKRMTNECTYLPSEDVLPKCSLLYQKYMVLNELNNLRINGQRIDNRLKQEIFERGYLAGELHGNITQKKLKKWLQDSCLIGEDDQLGGTSEVKILPKLQTYQDFARLLGQDFSKRYTAAQLESVVQAITILGNDKAMLRTKIAQTLNLPETSSAVDGLSKLSYKDWGRFSEDFLNGIRAKVDGIEMTILDALWQTNHNLMELLSSEFEFTKAIDTYNNSKNPPSNEKVTYEDVKNLYCSPAVKRTIWQTLRIVNELTKTLKHPPKKIFLEVTRGGDPQNKGYSTARKKQLTELYHKLKKDPEVQQLLEELDGKADRDLQQKKLFLYFTQMGKCAYSGDPIDLEELNNSKLYDIDHIYPRSKTKDDSILRNLVLVKAQLNREKTNIYPISTDIRTRMLRIWQKWWLAGLITKEKYERLTRSMPLTDDELGGFIARQIVETSQSVKAIRDLLQRAYPDSKIVMVKAGQVSNFRQLMGDDRKDQDGNIIKPGKPEFIKVRELNDFHHAKDAYLNIVVGNVINSTFTDDPRRWVQQRNMQKTEYSIRPEILFREAYEYRKPGGSTTIYPEVSGWDFANSLAIISNTMKRNDILWTRRSYIESGAISDLQLVPHSEKVDGLLKIKQDKRLDPAKYGGYNSLKGAHFALIECLNKKGEAERRIVQIPMIAKTDIDEYVKNKYGETATVILPVIRYKALIKINGFPVHLAGKSGGGLIYYHAVQVFFKDMSFNKYLKAISRIIVKDRELRGKYEIDNTRDAVSKEKNLNALELICDKLSAFSRMPGLTGKIPEILDNANKFSGLSEKQQIVTIYNFLKILKCNAETGDLSSFVPRAAFIGKASTGEDVVNKVDTICIINQSPTGLYEEIIDLKTVQPKSPKLPQGSKQSKRPRGSQPPEEQA